MITTQPLDYEGKAEEKATFTVKANGVGNLAYQWQTSLDNGITWSKTNLTGNNTDTLIFTISSGLFGRLFRCVITDENGSLISNSAELKQLQRFTEDGITYYIVDDSNVMVESYSGSSDSVTIPGNINGYTVSQIGPSAFEGNTYLESIDLPDSITIIGRRAFANCSNLREMK